LRLGGGYRRKRGGGDGQRCREEDINAKKPGEKNYEDDNL
jgi:hypothetical protein